MQHAIRLLFVCALAGSAAAQTHVVDLATIAPGSGVLRLYGSTGDGNYGVPVAGPADLDGDGFGDVAMAAMLTDPVGRTNAGSVYLLFGAGALAGSVDTAVANPMVLELRGMGPQETAGSELWLGDVTGDGIADVLIGRQNYSPDGGRIGAGALSIVVGSNALRQRAAALLPLDLDAPPAGIAVTTLLGTQVSGRLGIWMRDGDVDGDGIADLVIGADQEQIAGSTHAGSVYVVRGGSHLAGGGRLDLTAPGSGALSQHVARVLPPALANHYHLGATCQLADLDGNGRAEVLAAAALNRAGATLLPAGGVAGATDAIGGTANGSLYIAWDDNFPSTAWGAGQTFRIDQAPGGHTIVHGSDRNEKFGEEILGGRDYDGDGSLDLFVGDIVGDYSNAQNRFAAGTGHVFYDAAALRGRSIDLEVPPADLRLASFVGARSGDIAGDTAAHGDFDGDGIADLALAAPHAAPAGRDSAGAVFIFFGGTTWPALTDLGAIPGAVRVTEIRGAQPSGPGDVGDTLGYSASAGDFDGDGRDDLVVNEMVGNGIAPAAVDKGNLVVLDGRLLAGERLDSPCPPAPRSDCRTTEAGRSTINLRAGTTATSNRVAWSWTRGAATTMADFGDPAAGTTAYVLCLYDSSDAPQPVLSLQLPAQADCAAGDCWKAGGRGFRFRSPDGLPDGARRADLRPGDASRTSLKLRARGPQVDTPGSLTLPATAQFVRVAEPTTPCWGVEYLEAVHNGSDRFVARGP